MTTPSTCVVLGNRDTAEMRPVRDWLAAASLAPVDDLPSADLAVVCLNHPDEFSSREAERHLAAAPLARWVVCRSTWCESLGRTRDVWPFAVHVPARLAPGRLDAELAVIRGDRPPLPLTASRDETWEFDHVSDWEKSLAAGVRVLVDSPDRRLADTWTAILVEAGCVVAHDETNAPFDVVLLDGDPWDARTIEQLERLRGGGHTRLVVALTMPPARLDDEFGFADVTFVSKLAPTPRLVSALRE
jgi:hypothetical protein